MTVLETIFWTCAGVGAWTLGSSLYIYLKDRSGNSGRVNHWRDNPRLHGPDEE